jgi:hypothetical protein
VKRLARIVTYVLALAVGPASVFLLAPVSVHYQVTE